jgi:hypothetical protein
VIKDNITEKQKGRHRKKRNILKKYEDIGL